MAAPRLPFLYPNLLRSVRSCEPTTYPSIRFPPARRSRSARFHTRPAVAQETYHQRYGPAVERQVQPPPWSTGKGDILPPDNASKRNEKPGGNDQAQSSKDSSKQQASSVIDTADSAPHSTPENTISASSTIILSELPSHTNIDGGSGSAGSQTAETTTQKDTQQSSAPDGLESVFQVSDDGISRLKPTSEPQADSMSLMQSPRSEPQRQPSLSPHPYVHYFDSHAAVKSLVKGGFTEEQSISIMKAMRSSLVDNLNLAREDLMSKSKFENEVYLFRAAASELRNSIHSSRNAEVQALRAQRAQLQHEVDILSQKMTQELLGLKDTLKEMFDNQKISSKELQRSQDTGIQELNYQITVSLNSDGKRVVESLRWILTRRAAVAIATSASMIILALKLHSHKQQKGEKESAAAAAAAAAALAESASSEASPTSAPEAAIAESMG